MSLNQEVLRVRLYKSKWGARIMDKEVSAAARKAHNAAKDAGSFNKKLAPANFLTGVNSAFSVLDDFFKQETVSWDDDGWRLLPNDKYFEFFSRIGELKANITEEVEKIQANWDHFLGNEAIRLGDMYKATDYPTYSEIGDEYGIRIKSRPLQVEDDVRLNIRDDAAQAIRDEVTAENRDNHERALTDLWNRLYDPVSKLAERMQETELKGQKSLVTNIFDITQVLPKLNVFGDQDLEDMYREVEQKLTRHSMKKMKIDEDAHTETRQAVDEIMKKMEAFVS